MTRPPTARLRLLGLITGPLLALLLLAGPRWLPSAASPPDPPVLRLQLATFDPLALSPDLPSALSLDDRTAARSAYRLVQFTGPLQPTWLEALRGAGADPLQYIPDYALLVRLAQPAGQRDAGLAALLHVRWVGPVQPAYKLHPDLRAGLPGEVGGREVRAISYPGVSQSALAGQLQALAAQPLAWSGGERWGWTVRLEAGTDNVRQLARVDDLQWIEPVWPREALNDVARGEATGVDEAWSRLAVQGIDLYGAGQVVAIADSGLDTGNPATLSPDFGGRLLHAYALGRIGDWSDRNGHGTHVAGSAVGAGVQSGSDPANHDYQESFAGVAPEAGLVFQSVEDSVGLFTGLPDDLNDLFGPPVAGDGARVHSNSWGGPTGSGGGAFDYGGYTVDSLQADEFAWDHKDVVLLFAAGNAGDDADLNGVVDPDSINAPGTAKNVVTVGASESLRPSDGQPCWPPAAGTGLTNCRWGDLQWGFDAEPIQGDWLSDDIAGLAAFSSRGPTDDGRIKPDLVAPGVNIISNRSHHPVADSQWGSYDRNYVFDGGTSMSTPLVAGVAALVRQWYGQVMGVASPSAALVKATLLDGAANPAPGQYGSGGQQEIPDQVPNDAVGWGRLNLAESITPLDSRATWFADDTAGLATGQVREYVFTVGWDTAGPPATAPAMAGQPGAAAATPEAPRALEYLQNGDFESGLLAPWLAAGSTTLVNSPVHAGSWAAQLGGGNNASDRLRQAVQFPNDLTAVRLSFWYRVDSAEQTPLQDWLLAGFYDAVSGLPAYIPFELDAVEAGGQWTHYTLDVPLNHLGSLAGRQLSFQFKLTSNGTLPTTVQVDNASLQVTRPGDPTATPTPTPTATPTRTPTATPSPTPTLRPGEPTPTPTPPAVVAPLRVSLVWTDYPGNPVVAVQLVNDLDLEVELPDGRVLLGNDTDLLVQPDRRNPTESVRLDQAWPGVYRVRVRAANVPFGPQPFALVASGAHLVAQGASPTPTPTASPRPNIWLPLVLKHTDLSTP